MKPVKFEGQNFNFTKPAGWTDEQCGELPCFMDNLNGRVGRL